MQPLTPTRLGRYEIVDEIGKGAKGVVYVAHDPLIGRLVALKTFQIGFWVRDQEMERLRARFIREAQSAGILSHPNIVTIHDVVEHSDDGLAFIAMEYVRGTNLKALLQGDQPLTLPFVVEVIAQVADALDYAHSHRVIHRDVKPTNILITADNRVKITDFGIARLDTSNLTQEGQLLGTPNYMAPEQIQGKEVDHRADLFALGVVLYEMLTRRKPFQGENLTVVSHRIVYDHFTPPREYVQNLPPGLEAILSRALDKDPNRRYQKAKEMVADLRRVSGTLGGDDLNETQSLAIMGPLVATPPANSPPDEIEITVQPPLFAMTPPANSPPDEIEITVQPPLFAMTPSASSAKSGSAKSADAGSSSDEMRLPPEANAPARRFRVALSFAGEKRDYIAKVAALLAVRFGEAAILYDKFHEAEFARRDLGFYLPDLYHRESDLVVVVACPNYEAKEWCGLEWDAIFDLLKKRKNEEIMLCRFDRAMIRGMYSTAGFLELDALPAEQTATRILERLALNEGKPRSFYLSGAHSG